MSAKPPVRFVLGNRKTVVFCEPDVQSELQKEFRFRPKGYFFNPKYSMKLWDGWIQMLKRGTIATGLLLDGLEKVKEKFEVTLEDQRTTPNFRKVPEEVLGRIGGRNYQQECLAAMQKASRTGGLILSATGTGKTAIAGLYLASLKGSAVFVVDEITLLSQAKKSFSNLLGEEVGEIGMGNFIPQRVTVATVQSLHKHRDKPKFLTWFKTIEVLLIDEVHVAVNRRNIDVVGIIKPKAVFGLTATLQVEKPNIYMPTVALTGPVIFKYSMQQGIREEHLAQGVIVRVRMTQVGEAGDWQHAYEEDIVQNAERNACAISITTEAIARKHRVILFAEQLDHLDVLSNGLGHVKHQVMSGSQSREVRLAACEDMNNGTLPLIIANRVFGKGIDIPAADVAVDATGGSSLNGTVQRLGRMARKEEGKLGFILLDIVDKSPVSDKKSYEYNRFGTASRRRLKALQALGLPIRNVEWEGDAKRVLDRAEKLLRDVVEKKEKAV